MKILLTFLLLSILKTQQIELVQRKIFILHGTLSNCNDFMESTQLDQAKILCIETGASMKSLKPVEEQAKFACIFINKLSQRQPRAIKNGFYLIGFSQGGIIARYLVHTCKIVQKHIKRLILSGAPNMGVKKLPNTKKYGISPKNFIMNLIMDHDNWYYPWKNKKKKWSEKISSLQILDLKKKGPIIRYFENDVFGPEKFNKLNFFLNIVWNQDSIVKPVSSCGFEADTNGIEIDSFTTTKYFKTNKLGLRDMYLSGRFANCLTEGNHDFLNGDNVDSFMMYVTDDCKFNEKIFNKYSKVHLYQFCLYKKLTDLNLKKAKRFCMQIDPPYIDILKSSPYFKISRSKRGEIKKKLI